MGHDGVLHVPLFGLVHLRLHPAHRSSGTSPLPVYNELTAAISFYQTLVFEIPRSFDLGFKESLLASLWLNSWVSD